MKNILHLSDIHFGTNEDATNWHNQLAEDLVNELGCCQLDAVILSGDVANRSSEDEYAAAELFVRKLCKEFHVSADRVVIVPGNHDVNWGVSSKAYAQPSELAYVDRGEESDVTEAGSSTHVLNEERYKQRFSYFNSFYRSVRGEAYPAEYEDQYSLHHFPDMNLLVLGLNSAWQLDHLHTSRVSIHSNAVAHALTQVRTNPEYKDSLKIAVWHHPLNSPYEDRIKDHGFVEQLAKARFRFGLHGHIHKAEQALFRYDLGPQGRRLHIICAGTFGAPTKELVSGYPWQYNLLRLEAAKLKVETRRREEPNGSWKPDARWSFESGQTPLPYYEIDFRLSDYAAGVAPVTAPETTDQGREAALFTYLEKLLRDTRFSDYRALSRSNDASAVAALPFDETYIAPLLVPQRAHMEAYARQEQLLQKISSNTAPTVEDRARLEEEYATLAAAQWQPIVQAGSEEASIGKVLDQSPHAVVLGDPGVGKSSLARFVARACAMGETEMLARLGWGKRLVPVVIRIADFADERSNRPDLTLAEFIFKVMSSTGGEALRGAIEENLTSGTTLVVLEGIDEVPDHGDRINIVQSLDRFIDDFATNHFLITSRPSGYIRLRGNVAHFRLKYFSYDQIRKYVAAWHGAVERYEHGDAPNYERARWDAIETYEEIGGNQKLFEFATNPLLLTLIILIRRQGISLPTRRVQLFQLAVEVLMEVWNNWRLGSRVADASAGGGLSTEQLIQVWAAVAEWSHRTLPTGVIHRATLTREIARIIKSKNLGKEEFHSEIERYLDAATARAGILEERASNLFAFWHPSFEEYLAAVELATPTAASIERLLPLRDDPRWRDVILLTVAYIGTVQHDEGIATELVEAIADHDPDPFWEPLVYDHLRLAAACVADGPGLKRKVVEGVIARLADVIQRLPYEPLTPAFVHCISSLPDLQLTPQTIEAVSQLAFHPNEFVRREAARLFANVADTNEVAREWCLVMFDDPYYEVKYHAALGLARAGGHRYQVWRMLLSYGVMLEIKPELREYLAKGDEQAIVALRSCLDSQYDDIRFLATRFLIEMNRVDEKVTEALIRSLALSDVHDREVCERLLTHLIGRNGSVLDCIYGFLKDQSDPLRLAVARFLSHAGCRESRVIEAFSSCLNAEDLSVRWEASKCLWNHGVKSTDVMEAAASCLISDDVTLRGAAAETLLEMGYAEERVVESQLWCLSQPDPVNSAQRLLRMGKEREKVTAELRKRLNDADFLVRVESARLLVKEEGLDEQVIASLRSCLWSDNYNVRFYAWWALNEHNLLEGVLEALVRKLAVEGPFWRSYAKDSLESFLFEHAKVDKSEIEKTLVALLEDEDVRVRGTTAELLLDWGMATERALETVGHLIAHDGEDTLAVCRRLLRRQTLEDADGTRLLQSVQMYDEDSLAQRDARKLLYRWLNHYEVTRCASNPQNADQVTQANTTRGSGSPADTREFQRVEAERVSR